MTVDANITSEHDALPLPLEGIRVLDATHIVAGPFCSLILADMGAEVIKIERPRTGDLARGRGPFIGDADSGQVSSRFLGVNRNKKSVTLDLRNQTCQDAFANLVASADVLLDNWGPGAFRRLGFGYDRLSEINPRLIYAEITGYGDGDGDTGRGPYSDWPANNLAIQAMSGWMDITGAPGGARRKRSGTTWETQCRGSGPRWASCWRWKPDGKPASASTLTLQCTSAWPPTSSAT